ncbi:MULTISPECIES: sporulation protein [unclassified Myroides]|uniref:type IX secretion system periplasmic lipoprotein PorW/SprE n=1 Tax=unclassified Myroides TaxID=2642485 RepID=UPI0025752550|nr:MULTISPECIES: sporulation protein [unclassified Myroides]
MLNRGYHALTTKYNILFHGNESYTEALDALKEGYFDDYWEILPIERIQIEVDPEREFEKGVSLESKQGTILDNLSVAGTDLGNPESTDGQGFTRSENKAVKAIQKHSMYIKGRERNSQMANAYLLLGKSRYYDGRFVPALEAFNYILYKYPDSDLIGEAKVWREKTNLRLRYDDLAIKNLKELLRERKGRLNKQVESDAYAMLAQGYINLEQLDSASTALKSAVGLVSNQEEKARYNYILGQLNGRLDKKEDATRYFENIIAMNRKAPRTYTVHAYAEIFELSDAKKTDSVAFLKQYRTLLKDRDNRPYLDVLNRQVGLFYRDIDQQEKALEYLKTAAKEGKQDKQLKARNFLSIADIYFNSAGYAVAGQYYDSALALLPPKAKETFRISKRRESLREVVDLEVVAHKNDSILNLVALSTEERNAYFQTFIDQLRKEDFRKMQANLGTKNNSGADFFNVANFGEAIEKSFGDTNFGSMGGKTTFYFYSNQALTRGRQDFKRRWGNRTLSDNWRWSAVQSAANTMNEEEEEQALAENQKKKEKQQDDFVDPRYQLDTYVGKIPSDSTQIAKLKEDRDLAYFELGAIYSERFGKIEEGIDRLERLLTFDPKERLILPTMYKLYKLYQEVDPAKAAQMKAQIIATYPESRYAKLMQNLSMGSDGDLAPEQVYASIYQVFKAENYEEAKALMKNALENIDDTYVSKFELLNAMIIARTEGVKKYKEALNYLALTYSSTAEGREAAQLLEQVIPALENKQFATADSNNWKIIVAVPKEKIADFAAIKSNMQRLAGVEAGTGLKFTEDYYTTTTKFYVLHGFKSKAEATRMIGRLGDDPAYIPVMQEDYSVIQIKKNIQEYKAPGSVEP